MIKSHAPTSKPPRRRGPALKDMGLLSLPDRFKTPTADRERLQEISHLMFAREEEPPHVLHVARIALDLFDQTRALHGLGERERFWLLCGCLLHDIGWSVSADGSKHHKLSQMLIVNHEWNGLAPEEIALIGNVARYHRKALPKESHEPYAVLGKKHREIVGKLAAYLRLGDALDRTHLQRVVSVEIRDNDPYLVLNFTATASAEEEIGAVEKKKDLFERVFGRFVVCAQK
ncbi:MAG: HD domain-containing protein [Verrucomicrobiae bacterium]|nr:HD domain-containing protein [Verrucomicrobiae bacterium]